MPKEPPQFDQLNIAFFFFFLQIIITNKTFWQSHRTLDKFIYINPLASKSSNICFLFADISAIKVLIKYILSIINIYTYNNTPIHFLMQLKIKYLDVKAYPKKLKRCMRLQNRRLPTPVLDYLYFLLTV